uniref:Ig-like domain-containing protein n=1 Tax=Xenopus tropicalis TaxID=8364 RepID=A0A6I8RDU4_XENTR
LFLLLPCNWRSPKPDLDFLLLSAIVIPTGSCYLNSMTMHQPPFIPALVGDTVTIPCHFSISAKKKIQNMSLSSVQWSFSTWSSFCGTDIYNSATGAVGSDYKGRMSLAGEGGASIQIKHVGLSDSGWYCCRSQNIVKQYIEHTQELTGSRPTLGEGARADEDGCVRLAKEDGSPLDQQVLLHCGLRVRKVGDPCCLVYGGSWVVLQWLQLSSA